MGTEDPCAGKMKKIHLMLHEMYRCILCGRYARACGELRGVGALTFKKWMEECRLSLMEAV